MLSMLNIDYGSNESLDIITGILELKGLTELKTSIKLAKEKGPAPFFKVKSNRIKFTETPYIQKITSHIASKNEIIKEIIENGLRNAAFSTFGPTGCCIPETKIHTDKGILSLNEIFLLNDIDLNKYKNDNNIWIDPKVNINVETTNGNQKITKLYINGNSNTIKIQTKNGRTIEGTPDHKILIKDINNNIIWRELSKVLNSDTILIKK